jgi:hypothetical protein
MDTLEFRELEREEGLINDEQTRIDIPAQYKTFDMLINLDDDYYYFQDSADSEYWKWIALDRNTGEVIEYAPIDDSFDGKFTYGIQGDLYTCTMEWVTDLKCKFKILKLGKDGSVEICFEENTIGYPSAMPYKDHVVLNCCKKTEGRLFDLNLLTGEKTIVMEYGLKELASGYFGGTRVSGLEYSTMLPSDKGFCYAVDEVADNPVGPYTYDIYYYSFADKKSSYLCTVEGDELGYIGGDGNAFVLRLWQPGVLQEGTDPGSDTYINENEETDGAICIYVNEKGNYIRYIVPPHPEISCLDIRGSGVFGNGDYIAYGDGMYYIDTKTGKYDSIKYFVGDPEGLGFQDLDIYDEVWGNFFDGSAFYFTSKDAAGTLTLHTITRAER